MVKLKRLKIEKYRNVKPGTELHFRDSLNVLLGRNGTGKTTLLNLAVRLVSWDFLSLHQDELSIEYELETTIATFSFKLRNRLLSVSADWSDEFRIAASSALLSMGQEGLRHEMACELLVTLKGTGKKYQLELEGTKLTLRNVGSDLLHEVNHSDLLLGRRSYVNVVIASARVLLIPETESLSLMQALFSLGMDSVQTLRRFDESLDYIRSAAGLGVSFVVTGTEKGYSIDAHEGIPQSIAKQILRVLENDPDVDEIRLQSGHDGDEFLGRTVELLGFHSAQMRIQRISKITDPFERIELGAVRFDFVRGDGSVISHPLLSYGQKRLVAFYYYLASNPSCIVADELVNGMHHDWIGACLDDLGDRQAFLTSQNPLLLDYLSFESAEEVRSSFVLCCTELREGREQLVWENMTAEDAEGFFKAYQVAIQHVSELLRTRGLW